VNDELICESFDSHLRIARGNHRPSDPRRTKQRSKTMNLLEMDVDQSFTFHCPITGALILSADGFEPSAATAFSFCPEAGDFDMAGRSLRSLWRTLNDRYGDDEFFPDLWRRFCRRLAKRKPEIVIFGFTSHGMACGPVSSTIYLGIDFSYSFASRHEP
jgi:hypothetical protein